MAKSIYVVNPNYVRRGLPELIKSVGSNELKKASEERMAIYDAQPKMVRLCIHEQGMRDKRALQNNRLSARQKCDALRNATKTIYEKSSVLLTD